MSAGLIGTFEALKSSIKAKINKITIDSHVSKLHYRFTTILLLTACVLVCSRQYVGEHIQCINDAGIPQHFMKTYCFIHATFTVNRHYNVTSSQMGAVAHPGVGLDLPSDETTRHNYYQWVPFVLFFQAIAFYLPHLVWKAREGGRIKALVSGIEYAHFSLTEKEFCIDHKTVPSKQTKNERLALIRREFLNHNYVNKSWSFWFVMQEVAYVANLVLQFHLTDVFLGGKFRSLGVRVVSEGLEVSPDVLDEVFPKATKCAIHKYGPSGSIQRYDALCIMALNIINEKIYTLIWFWFIFLFAVSVWAVIWRCLTIFLHARSPRFNAYVFSHSCPGKLNPWRVLTVTRNRSFADWLFLYYLSKNMNGHVFRDLFIEIATELDDVAIKTATKAAMASPSLSPPLSPLISLKTSDQEENDDDDDDSIFKKAI